MRNFVLSLALLFTFSSCMTSHSMLKSSNIPFPQTASEWMQAIDTLAVSAITFKRVSCLFHKEEEDKLRCEGKVEILNTFREMFSSKAALLIPLYQIALEDGLTSMAQEYQDTLLILLMKGPEEFMEIRTLVGRLFEK